MLRSSLPRRSSLVPALAVTALAALLPVVGGTAVAVAAPEPDCAEAYPLADVAPGLTVDGATVSQGTEPQPFDGTVLGVVRDGIAPGVDMIVADLDSPAIEAAGGIWQGMSGSPVYADGRLLGAVSYGLSNGPSSIAGITPFDAMDDYLPEVERRVALGPALQQRVVRSADVSARLAGGGLSELEVPLGVSGVPARLLAQAARKADGRPWFSGRAHVMGSAGRAPGGPSADALVAGGNLGASLAYGDVSMAGVGTVTSVCGDSLVGFGHPLTFAGDDLTLGLHPAEAVYVQPESLGAPFKVANLGDPVGTVTDDHLTGITGTVGASPATIKVVSDITSGERHRVGTSYVTVPAALGEVAFYQHIGNHQTVVDESGPGTERQTWTIRGFDRDGTPFRIVHSAFYASEQDLLFASAWGLPGLLERITRLPGVRITSVRNVSVVDPDAELLKLGPVKQRVQGGDLVPVDRRRPAVVKPGGTLRLVLSLRGGAEPRTTTVSFDIPRTARSVEGAFLARGGATSEDDFYGGDEVIVVAGRTAAPRTRLDALIASLRNQPRADQVSVSMYLYGRRTEIERTVTSKSLGAPVKGYKVGSVVLAK
ncbi:SpoIVB peptidase S55 domain-containing protein [Nocardioides marinquilinus]|uniref:SpoIVB peptidase S55 domain-containing protein n=1 Tax=Nocardioides marinquilinus TaxID=1210400 RepID=A0ABP9P7T3_9ACTN